MAQGSASGPIVQPASSTLTLTDFTSIDDALRTMTLIAANGARKSLMIRNDTDVTIPIKEGSGVSLSSYTMVLQPGETYTTSFPAYTGAITGYFDAIPFGRLILTERI